ncbi:diguanylate cyclase domain-containing protein [Grimontia marina]|uniref:Cyclic di-GMP phosphodiesterase Gmr n=1 Tax=Grimontia marina TaxID=646534 RepID=A0A128FJW9_9GAMM|nr:diguanylate cyclase [Grimontia marina]CZF86594.1 Cyclic di-GMP phosphodiesterase Gmr [Grimontia marina]
MANLSPYFIKISKYYNHFFIVFACLLVFSESVCAKPLSERQKIQLDALKGVSMCVEPNWLPFEYINQDGEFVGVLADYAALISDKLGVTFHLHPTGTYQQSLEAVKAGNCDIIVAEVATEEKRQDFLFTKPYFTSHRALATHADASFVGDLNNLAQETIGLLRDSPASEILPKLYPHLDFQVFSSTEEGLKKVETKEIFGFVNVLGSLVFIIQEHNITNVKIGGVLPSNAKLSMLVNRDLPELVELLDYSINEITPLDRKEIFERWFPVKYETGFEWGLFWSVVSAILVCAMFTVGLFYQWNMRLKQEIRLRRSAEKKITKLALSDPLTKLANRIRFNDDLKVALELAEAENGHVALAILDLDDFKPVNDEYGHPIGDECLKIVADRLLMQCRDQDTVARLGGDEFAIVYSGPESREYLPDIAERLIESVGQPIFADGIEIQVGLSIGYAFYPDHCDNSDSLIRYADEALYVAKKTGKNKFRIYEPDAKKTSNAAVNVNEASLTTPQS